jgi:hypothetical protein
LARRHNVSRSFVIAVALAEAFGIDEQERYIGGVSIRPRRIQGQEPKE